MGVASKSAVRSRTRSIAQLVRAAGRYASQRIHQTGLLLGASQSSKAQNRNRW